MEIDFLLRRDGRDARRRAARRGHAIKTLAPHREVNRAVVMPPALRHAPAARDAADREWRSAFRRHDAQIRFSAIGESPSIRRPQQALRQHRHDAEVGGRGRRQRVDEEVALRDVGDPAAVRRNREDRRRCHRRRQLEPPDWDRRRRLRLPGDVRGEARQREGGERTERRATAAGGPRAGQGALERRRAAFASLNARQRNARLADIAQPHPRIALETSADELAQ